jgi:hypothetical protein
MRDCWSAKLNEATYAAYLFTGKPFATVYSSARRAIRTVCAEKGWHSSFDTFSVAAHRLFGLGRDTLWIRPELPYRWRAGQHAQQCSVAWSGVLLSDLQTKTGEVREQSGRLRESGSRGARRTQARNL